MAERRPTLTIEDLRNTIADDTINGYNITVHFLAKIVNYAYRDQPFLDWLIKNDFFIKNTFDKLKTLDSTVAFEHLERLGIGGIILPIHEKLFEIIKRGKLLEEDIDTILIVAQQIYSLQEVIRKIQEKERKAFSDIPIERLRRLINMDTLSKLTCTRRLDFSAYRNYLHSAMVYSELRRGMCIDIIRERVITQDVYRNDGRWKLHVFFDSTKCNPDQINVIYNTILSAAEDCDLHGLKVVAPYSIETDMPGREITVYLYFALPNKPPPSCDDLARFISRIEQTFDKHHIPTIETEPFNRKIPGSRYCAFRNECVRVLWLDSWDDNNVPRKYSLGNYILILKNDIYFLHNGERCTNAEGTFLKTNKKSLLKKGVPLKDGDYLPGLAAEKLCGYFQSQTFNPCLYQDGQFKLSFLVVKRTDKEVVVQVLERKTDAELSAGAGPATAEPPHQPATIEIELVDIRSVVPRVPGIPGIAVGAGPIPGAGPALGAGAGPGAGPGVNPNFVAHAARAPNIQVVPSAVAQTQEIQTRDPHHANINASGPATSALLLSPQGIAAAQASGKTPAASAGTGAGANVAAAVTGAAAGAGANEAPHVDRKVQDDTDVVKNPNKKR